tara:strand:- start:102 stop:803 length:702 start_codon:yes stop_codon:yes gene_type:complete
MDIFYSNNIIGEASIELSSLESHHCIVVLRKEIGNKVQVLDGDGGQYKCEIIDDNKKKVILNIINKKKYVNKKPKIHLVIAPTKSHDRIEWLIEKSVEIGVSEISFIKTSRTIRKKINIDRIKKIALSAMKQSGQFFLPIINNLDSFKSVVSKLSEKQLFIGHLESDDKQYISKIYDKNKDCCLMIGPEGDFSIDEIDLAKKNNFKPISLGDNRLRTETAGIYAVSVIRILNE